MNWQARDIMNRLAASSSLLQEVTEQELHDLKSVLLGMMQDIHDVCMARDIRYTLVGGSILGAIRHQGFIPWDDDIDIAMRRKDWERFKDIFQIVTFFFRFFCRFRNIFNFLTQFLILICKTGNFPRIVIL